MLLGEVWPSKAPAAGTVMDAERNKNGTLAMIIYAIVVLPAPSVADGRVCAGFKGLDEEVLVQ